MTSLKYASQAGKKPRALVPLRDRLFARKGRQWKQRAA